MKSIPIIGLRIEPPPLMKQHFIHQPLLTQLSVNSKKLNSSKLLSKTPKNLIKNPIKKKTKKTISMNNKLIRSIQLFLP